MTQTTEAQRILDACLEGRAWDDADLRALISAESSELFSVLAEGLSDRFEPRLGEAYADIFAQVIAAALHDYTPAELVERHRRVRRLRAFEGDARRVRAVYVLSRVTLGADVAVTSVLLDAAKRRFPTARIIFAGPEKGYELFSADPRIEHLPVAYGRNGGLRDRVGVWQGVRDSASIVIDPDSRITQLGLLPVCPEENYYFFDSRSWGGDGEESLGCLARQWADEILGVAGAQAFIAPAERPEAAADVAVSLGVGENAAKIVPPPFEEGLLRFLAGRGSVIVDAGAGGEEAERVRRAIEGCGGRVETWNGSFAGFASILSRSRLYAGYDSAGQHVAAACGVPLVSVFAGYPCGRFCQRWRPAGPGPGEVVRVWPGESPASVLARTLAALTHLPA
ncbi:MAG: hypothetical protein ABSD56_06225 [Bryobacteraceae bacterium]